MIVGNLERNWNYRFWW